MTMIPNPSQEPPASSKAQNQDVKDMDVLCTFKINIESQNLEHRYIKDNCPNPNQDRDPKPQSGTSSVLQTPKSGLKGHGYHIALIINVGLSEVQISLEVILTTAYLY